MKCNWGKKHHLSFHCSVFILESAFGFIKVTRIFRSIEPAVVQRFQTRVPNSRNTDRRVDFYVVQWKDSWMVDLVVDLMVCCHVGVLIWLLRFAI
jgi:hypothetical protein